MPSITTIGFDADDTLWHNERFFRLTQDRFAALLADYAARPFVSKGGVEGAGLAVEEKNGRFPRHPILTHIPSRSLQ